VREPRYDDWKKLKASSLLSVVNFNYERSSVVRMGDSRLALCGDVDRVGRQRRCAWRYRRIRNCDPDGDDIQ